jgi:hypothetical protein
MPNSWRFLVAGAVLPQVSRRLFGKTRTPHRSDQSPLRVEPIHSASPTNFDRVPNFDRVEVLPLGGLWESDILPLLVTRPGVRPVTVLEEMQRSHPDRDWHRLRRTLERRVRAWCAEHGGTTGHGDSNQGEERAHSN